MANIPIGFASFVVTSLESEFILIFGTQIILVTNEGALLVLLQTTYIPTRSVRF